MGKLWWYEDAMFLGEKIRCANLAQAEVNEGGWYDGRTWLTDKAIKDAEHRWAMRSDETRADKHIDKDILPHYELACFQCGGCKFMAALDTDYGICWNKDSPLDGCIVFEHGGCTKHNALVEIIQEKIEEMEQ